MMVFMTTPPPTVAALKPTLHIQALIDAFSEVRERRHAVTGKRFQLLSQGKPMCFLLCKGSCVISRGDDALVISTISAPNIVGVNALIPVDTSVVIEATSDINYLQVSLDEFLAYTQEKHMWEHVAYLLMFYSSRLYEYQRTNAGIPTYKIISNLLYALSNEDFETRAMTSAAEYIQERTFLSRSGIMKVLSELKTGGYIVLKRGLLIKINKLPEKF